MSEKKVGKRLLTWVLVLVMTLSLLPLNVLAVEGDTAGNTNTDTKYSTENSGANLVKSATKNADGTYTIKLESWVTGKVEQTTGSAPLDIVLVLDQSGSMNENGKLDNLKNAVFQFVNKIKQDAADHSVTHRIAIVGFASDKDDGESDNGTVSPGSSDSSWINTGLFIDGKLKNYQTYQGQGTWENVYLPNGDDPQNIYEYRAYHNYLYRNITYNETTQQWGYWPLFGSWHPVEPKTSANDNDTDHVQVQRRAKKGYIDLTAQDYQAALVDSKSQAITDAIGNLAASGATRASYGMEMASNVFANNSSEGRSRVVVFFTDGEPGRTGYSQSEANSAIGKAYTAKNTYNAKVFSVGMIDDDGGDVGNFMNYVSSNYPNALSMDNPGEPADTKYYMNVTGGDLSAVFQTISGSILKPSVEADANTDLTDTLSPYFTFDGAAVEDGTVTGVTVQKQKYNGAGQPWGEPETVENVNVALNPTTKAVTVRGFDYSSAENVVTDGATPSGHKLVVTFNVKPDINCKNWTDSKEYETNNDTATLANGNDTFATVASPEAPVDTYKVTYTFAGKAPSDVARPEDTQYYISGQWAKVKQPGNPDNTGDFTYTFKGWKNGDEDVTDEKIPISGNVTLTGTWTETANTASYTVNYLEKGTGNVLHTPKSDTKKKGDRVKSSDEVIDIDGYNYDSADKDTLTIGTGDNVINIYYTKRNDLSYTVNYLEKGTNAVLHEQKVQTGVTFGAEVTSTNEKINIDGYNYDSADKDTLTIGTGDNVINIYYTKKTDLSYKVNYLEKTTNKVLHEPKTVSDVAFEAVISSANEKINIDGYNYDSVDKETLTIGTGENVINIYYTKKGSSTFDFNNVDGKGAHAITKTVTGNAGTSFTDKFEVIVEGTDASSKAAMTGTSYTGTANVTYSDRTKVAFDFGTNSKLSFDAVGKYTYKVQERKGTSDYMSYDTTAYTLTIMVDLNKESTAYEVTSWYFTAGMKEYAIKTPLNITNTYYKPTYRPPTPTVVIPDDDALGLNTTDHFAYIVGYGNGEVRPQNNITRAEVATIFFRLLTDDVRDENLTKTNRYSDVAATSWYNTAVSTLSSMGIITGYPDGTFRPNAAITRAEFAAIAARFDNNGDKTAAKFSDIATHWAKDEISIAYNNGWITGYPDGTFGPQRDITRAETMTLVNRVLNRQPETEDDLLPNMTVWTDNANPKAWYYLAVQEATNSHYYKFKTNSKYEKWTELRETRDWTQLEK